MRRRKIALFALALLAAAVFTATGARAAERDMLGIDRLEGELPEGAGALSGESVDGSFDAGGAMQRVAAGAVEALGGIVRGAARSAALVLAAALLTSAAGSFAPKASAGINYINLVGALVISVSCLDGVRTLVGEAVTAINELSDFSKLILPTLASASAVTGAAASGAARYAAASLFLDILMTLGQRVVVPLIYMYAASSCASAAFGGELGGITKLIAQTVKLLLTFIAISFTVYINSTALIASSADASAVKVTKTAISTLLPVVGGMVSDAADAVASGVGVLRAAAGAFGSVAVVAICAVPFLKLAVGSLMFKAAAALAETLTDTPLTKLIDSISTAYGMLLGLAGTIAVMLFISIISASKAVGA